MEIKSLKDLKVALKDIPEEKLDNFGFGYDDEGEEVQLLYFSTDARGDAVSEYITLEKKYPQIKDINNWIKAIIEVGIKADEQEIDEATEEMISSKRL